MGSCLGTRCWSAGTDIRDSDDAWGVEAIRPYVEEFIRFAETHPEQVFLVTEIGCGIAGFAPDEIAPLFAAAVPVQNVFLPERFWEVLKNISAKA